MDDTTLDLLQYISAPFSYPSRPPDPTHSPDALLNDIASKCREKVPPSGTMCQLFLNCGPLTPAWNFTVTVLDVLLRLRNDMEVAEANQSEEERGIEVISIQAQLNVQKCVEIIVGFGLAPYLLPGVGVPEKVRKRNIAALEIFLDSDLHVPPLIKFHRLAQVTDILVQIVSFPSLGALIIPKHAGDILAALLQITNSPIAKPGTTSKSGSLSHQEYEYVMKLRERFQVHFNSFLALVPKQIFISVLFLIGQQPKFIRQVCTEMIRDVIISQKDGVILTASVLLSEAGASNVWKIAKVVGSLVKDSLSVVIDVERKGELIRQLAFQCVEMVRSGLIYTVNCFPGLIGNLEEIQKSESPSGKQDQKTHHTIPFGISKEMIRVGLFCSLVLMDIDFRVCKLFVWDHLFKAVLDLGQRQSQDQCEAKTINKGAIQVTRVNEDIITCVDIERVIAIAEVAEGLLSLVIPTGICVPLSDFQPLWSLLFKALVACQKYLERKVQESEVSQLALMLKNRLENLFILMFEVLAAGSGEKLNVTLPLSTKDDTASDEAASSISQPSQEKMRLLCKFCVELPFNETLGINSFDLASESNPNGSSKVKVKIAQILTTDTHFCEHGNVTGMSQQHAPSKQVGNDKWDNEDGNAFELLAEQCIALCSILKHERLTYITSQLFRQLLNYEHESIIGARNENRLSTKKDTTLCAPDGSKEVGPTPNNNSSRELTQLEIELGKNESHAFRKFVCLKLLEELGGDEKTMENCVKMDDYRETLSVVELVMRKLATELEESSCTQQDFEFSQTILFALGFLGTIVETASNATSESCASDEFWNELQHFAPHLKLIAESNNSALAYSGITSMAENIVLGIQSRGKVGKGKTKEKVQVAESELAKALQDVASPVLPIKGHGLLQLRRLIQAKDPETLKNYQNLLEIFQKELTDADSYIYLMAIQGLAALGLRFHKIVIPVLIEEYDFINPDNEAGECKRNKMYKTMEHSERIECRMKIGETLVKVIQQLGEMAPVYRVPLTNLFFRVVRDDEPMIRSSALSNLGELCHVLRFSIGAVLTEVWFNIEAVLSCETDLHVRRAALHLLVLLLKGVEKEFSPAYFLTDLELGTYIRDARRLLTRIEQGESDPVSKSHAQLALHELELIVQKLLSPKQELTHKIRVLL